MIRAGAFWARPDRGRQHRWREGPQVLSRRETIIR